MKNLDTSIVGRASGSYRHERVDSDVPEPGRTCNEIRNSQSDNRSLKNDKRKMSRFANIAVMLLAILGISSQTWAQTSVEKTWSNTGTNWTQSSGGWEDPSDWTFASGAFSNSISSFFSASTEDLYLSGFGFSASDIPVGASIDSFHLTFNGYKSNTTPRNVQDDYIRVRNNTVNVLSNNLIRTTPSSATWATTLATGARIYRLGSSAFTRAQVIDAAFGLGMRVSRAGGGTWDAAPNAHLSAISLKIFYTAATPTITHTASALSFSETYGTESAASTFAVTGTNTTAGITATLKSSLTNIFEISADGTSWSSTATLAAAGGTVHIRTKATAPAGTSAAVTDFITLSSTGATDVNIGLSSYAITPLAVSVTLNAQTKCHGSILAGSASTAFTMSTTLPNSEAFVLNLTSPGFAAGASAGAHNISVSSVADAGTTGFNASNYNITYTNNGTSLLTVMNVVSGSITGAGNVDVCNGYDPSLNFVFNGAASFDAELEVTHPITLAKQYIPFTSTIASGVVFAQTFDKSFFVNTGNTPLTYTVKISSLEDGAAISADCPASSLGGSVTITVHPVPVITAAPNTTAICGSGTVSIDVNATNAVPGTYSVIADYGAVTGGAYGGLGVSGIAYTTDITETLTNATSAPVTVVYTIKATGTSNSCGSEASVISVTIQPTVEFGSVAVGNGESFGVAFCEDQELFITFAGLRPGEQTLHITKTVGSATPETLNWTVDASIDGAAQESLSASLAPGTYTYTVDSITLNGCTLSDLEDNTITFTVNPMPTFSFVEVAGTESTEAAVCQNNLAAQSFVINGLLESTEQVVTYTINGAEERDTIISSATGTYTFDASMFSDGTVAPGEYVFVITKVTLGDCFIDVTEANNVTLTVKPTPTITSIAGPESVCINTLDEALFTVSGLLEADQTINVTVNGAETVYAIPVSAGDYTITAAEFASVTGLTLTPATYTINVVSVVVDGCTLTLGEADAVAVSVAILPAPEVASFGITANKEFACFSERGDITVTLSGLMNGVNSFTYDIYKNGEFLQTNTDELTVTEGTATFAVSEFTGSAVTYGSYELKVVSISHENSCAVSFNSEATNNSVAIELYPDAEIAQFLVNGESSAIACVETRSSLNFTIGGLIEDGAYTFDYTITSGDLVISTDEYAATADASGEVTFDGSIFAGASVVPGNFTVTINAVALANENGECTKEYTTDAPAVNVTLEGLPVVALAIEDVTVYVNESCQGFVPDLISNVSATVCGSAAEISVEQLVIVPGEDVISHIGDIIYGYGGERLVVFQTTVSYIAGGSVTVSDTIPMHIVDTIAPAVAMHSGLVRNLDGGTATLTAIAAAASATDNCSPVTLSISKDNVTFSSSVAFSCDDAETNVPVWLKATDLSGNVTVVSGSVLVDDVTAPVVVSGTLPDTTVAKGNLCTNVLGNYIPYLLSHLELSDVCTDPADLTITQTPLPTAIIAASGTSQVVSFAISDGNGNTLTQSFTVNFVDMTAPVIAGVPTGVLNASIEAGDCDLEYSLPVATATDNCSGVGAIVVKVNGTIVTTSTVSLAVGTHLVEYAVADAAGNDTAVTYTLNVTAEMANPIFAEHTTIVDGTITEGCATTVTLPEITAMTGACESLEGVSEVTITNDAPATFGIGTTTVTYTATYTYNGETYMSTTTVNVEVTSEVAPVITNEAEFVTINLAMNNEGCTRLLNANDIPALVIGEGCEFNSYEVSWTLTGDGVEAGESGNFTGYPAALNAGSYEFTYTVTDGTLSTSVSVTINVASTLSGATLTGPTTPAVVNETSTSTVLFTAEGGSPRYTFYYDVFQIVDDERVAYAMGQEVTTTIGVQSTTVAHSNATAGSFVYVLNRVEDGNGCNFFYGEGTNPEVAIHVIEPQGIDLRPTISMLPPSINGATPKAFSVRLLNVGDAPSSGAIKFRIVKPRAGNAITLTGLPTGWTVTTTLGYWDIQSPSDVVIPQGGSINVPATITYTGTVKGAANLTVTLNATINGGDTNTANNSATRKININ